MDADRGENVQSVVSRLFTRERKQEHLVLELLRSHWADVVGNDLAGRCRPTRLQRGLLWVAAADACWAHELQFLRGDLLNSVQTYLEGEAVREIRLTLRPGAEPEHASATEEEAAAPEAGDAPNASAAKAASDDTPADPGLTAAAEAIPDESLRRAFLKGFGSKQRRRPPATESPPTAPPPEDEGGA